MADEANARLVALNSKTLGANMPEITLKDGSKVQTGTVGALLQNIKTYNALDSNASREEKETLEDAFRAAMPLLVKVGFFNLFEPEEWVNGSGAAKSPGRQFVGKLAIEHFAKSK